MGRIPAPWRASKHVNATANKENILAPLSMYRNHAKSTGTWTLRFQTSSFETQSTISDCIKCVFLLKKYWRIQSHLLQVSSHFPLLKNSTEDSNFVRCRIPNTFTSHHTPLNGHPDARTLSFWIYWLGAQGMVSPARCGSFESDPSHFALERVETSWNAGESSRSWTPRWFKWGAGGRLKTSARLAACAKLTNSTSLYKCKGMFQICLHLRLTC